MAKPRVPIKTLQLAYAIAQERGVSAAATELCIPRRTVYNAIWAAEVGPAIKKGPGSETTEAATTAPNDIKGERSA